MLLGGVQIGDHSVEQEGPTSSSPSGCRSWGCTFIPRPPVWFLLPGHMEKKSKTKSAPCVPTPQIGTRGPQAGPSSSDSHSLSGGAFLNPKRGPFFSSQDKLEKQGCQDPGVPPLGGKRFPSKAWTTQARQMSKTSPLANRGCQSRGALRVQPAIFRAGPVIRVGSLARGSQTWADPGGRWVVGGLIARLQKAAALH